MSQLRRQAVTAMARVIENDLGLKEPITIIAAPPSAVADSPRAAIWLERFRSYWTHEDELEVDEDGELMVGSRNTIEGGVGTAMIQDGVHLSLIGTLRGSGRIWVGARLAPSREELESTIAESFTKDPVAPGRMLVTIESPKVGKFVLPWSWVGAIFTDSSEWSSEFAFSERLWSWMRFDLEISILVPRYDPLITEFRVTLDADISQRIENDNVVADGNSVTISYDTPI
jgi:hypothetical protein